MTSQEEVINMLVKARWDEYARVRFTAGGTQERQAWDQFVERTQSQYGERQRLADGRGVALDYGVWNLRMVVLRALDAPCKYCTECFGLQNFALSRGGGEYVGKTIRRKEGGYTHEHQHMLRNLVVCCQRCADARGDLSESCYIDVLQALRAADDRTRADVLVRMSQGARQKVLPGPRRPRVTREGRGVGRGTRKK
jgi:hypothetical protein